MTKPGIGCFAGNDVVMDAVPEGRAIGRCQASQGALISVSQRADRFARISQKMAREGLNVPAGNYTVV